jgi:branched-chain amino acid transport system substrate-binding protein
VKPASQFILRAAALSAIVVALAACGSNNNASNNTSNKPASAAATQPAASATATKAATSAIASPAAAASAAAATATGPVKTVKIGAAFSLTGAAAQYGVTQKNGVQLAVDEINASGYVPGVKIDLSVEDDASTKDQAINVFQQFINGDKDVALLGPTLSNSAQAADPVAQQAKVPVLGVSNTGTGITSIGDYIFRDSLAEADVVPQTVQASMQKLGYKTVAVLYANDDAFSKAGYDAFKGALDKNNVKIVDTETFSTNDKDFSAQLANVKTAKPDAIIVSALIDPAVGISTQARKLGLTQPIIGGNGFNSPAFIKSAGDAAEGVIVGAAWNSASSLPASQAFIKAYQAKYNSPPDQFAAQAYTGVYIVAQAMKLANGSDREAIKSGLGKIKDFPTVLGTFNFTSDRDAQHQAVIQVVKGGQFVPLQ